MKVINPATEELVADYAEHASEQVEQSLRRARQAFAGWRDARFSDRAACFLRLSDTLRSRATDLALLMATEMGKILSGGESEILKCATTCDYFAKNAEQMLRPENLASDASRSYVRHDPLGVVLAIMPWNFPFWQFFRFAAPALMAGNVAALKHAP